MNVFSCKKDSFFARFFVIVPFEIILSDLSLSKGADVEFATFMTFCAHWANV